MLSPRLGVSAGFSVLTEPPLPEPSLHPNLLSYGPESLPHSCGQEVYRLDTGGRGEDQNSSHCLFSPPPCPEMWAPLHPLPRPPPGALHSRVGRRKELHADRECGFTAGDSCPALLAQGEEGPPWSQQTRTQAYGHSRSFLRGPVVPGFSLHQPCTSLGDIAGRHRWPGLLSPNGLFLSSVSESRTTSPAVGSPSARARRVRTHLLPRAPGPPGGATPGFAVGSAAASCAVGLWASPLLFLGPGVPV